MPRSPVPRRGSLETLRAGDFSLLGEMWHLGEHTVFPSLLFNMMGEGRRGNPQEGEGCDPAPTPLISQTLQAAAPALTGLVAWWKHPRTP